MKILLIHTSDYLHHPVLSRQHNIYEILADRHEVHTVHFHVSRNKDRDTKLIVHEVTMFPFINPLLHYIFNAPYHYYIFDKIMREEHIDVVVMSNVLASSAAIYAAKKHGIPTIFDLSDWLPDSAAAYMKSNFMKGLVRNAVQAITLKNLKNCDMVTTHSPYFVDKLKGYGIKSQYITNGVDIDIFKCLDGKQKRAELGLRQNDFVIGFAGSIESWYDIKSMIMAMVELTFDNSHIKLLLVGGPLFTSYFIEMQQLSLGLGVSRNVIFTNLVPYSELPEYIACMDVCVMPLLPKQWADGALPNKYFEYSACGKPILMTPMPIVEAMGGGNLYIYKNGEEYIEQIRKIMREKLVFNIDMEKHSWKNKAKEMEDVMKRLMEK